MSQDDDVNREPFDSAEAIERSSPCFPPSSPLGVDREVNDWIEQARHEPRFCLPELAIEHLAARGRTHPPYLRSDQARREEAFTTLCRRFFAIGFLDQKPIRYYCFEPPLPVAFPAGTEATAAGWTPAQRRTVEQLVDTYSEEMKRRIRGHVGLLLSLPTYARELASLRQHFDRIPQQYQPIFPMSNRALSYRDPSGFGPPTLEMQTAFATAFSAFSDRWGLIGLVWWDLPDPQGPLYASPPNPLLSTPRNSLSVRLSPFQPVLHSDDIRHMFIQQQENQMQELGTPQLTAAISRYKNFARIAEVDLWERVILSRFPSDSRPRGLIAEVEQILAGILGLNIQRVQALRKKVLSYRRQRIEAVSPDFREPQ